MPAVGLRPYRTQMPAPQTAHPVVRFIWAEMHRQRVSQEDVAERAGWSSSAMRKWKRRGRALPLRAAEDVLAVLGFELVIQEKR